MVYLVEDLWSGKFLMILSLPYTIWAKPLGEMIEWTPFGIGRIAHVQHRMFQIY